MVLRYSRVDEEVAVHSHAHLQYPDNKLNVPLSNMFVQAATGYLFYLNATSIQLAYFPWANKFKCRCK